MTVDCAELIDVTSSFTPPLMKTGQRKGWHRVTRKAKTPVPKKVWQRDKVVLVGGAGDGRYHDAPSGPDFYVTWLFGVAGEDFVTTRCTYGPTDWLGVADFVLLRCEAVRGRGGKPTHYARMQYLVGADGRAYFAGLPEAQLAEAML